MISSVVLFCAALSHSILTDADVLRLAKAPLDHSEKQLTAEMLGTYNGKPLIAEYRCGDTCPQSTVRILYLDVQTEKECARAKGKMSPVIFVRGLGRASSYLCVPKVLLDD